MLLQPLLTLFILIDILFMSIWTGQGGSRIDLNIKDVNNSNFSNINEDRFRKLGILYFNPGDPTIFIEKRYGVGWGFN